MSQSGNQVSVCVCHDSKNVTMEELKQVNSDQLEDVLLTFDLHFETLLCESEPNQEETAKLSLIKPLF